ncbi:DUF7845 domain-containing protein [Salinigranum rubrum]|nr:Lrp/AsnC family transcriptional regulator [Salinigranum rubrum]
MTDVDDFFEQLDSATAVTTNSDDSVESTVEQPDADADRQDSGTDGLNVEASPRTVTVSSASRYAARCRFCRRRFETTRDALAHEGMCESEPVAHCLYCKHPHVRRADPTQHFNGCEEYEAAQRAAGECDEDPDLEEEPITRQFIIPQPHEFHAYLKWDCSHLANPLRSYFGLRSLQGEHDFEEHGRLRAATEIDGKEWAVEFGFKGSGIAPRDDPGFRLDEVREYLVYVYPKSYSSWSDAASEGRKRAYFRISPRWPDIETVEGSRSMSNPCNIEGYDVEMEGSNWEFEQYPHVLQAALASLAERQGFRFNSPTPIHPEDFAPGDTHPSSNIVDAELYVRVAKGTTGRVIAFDGVLHRVSLLLSGDREGYAKTVRDDRECPGYYHTATIDSMRAHELIGGHSLAKEFKHYHVRNPDAVAGTALENPKIGVSFQNSIHDDTLYWDDRDQLVRELDEALLNVLEWSDIPTRPDSQYFVADDYFEVTGSGRWRKILRYRLPRIEQKQDDLLFCAASRMNSTDAALVDSLLTDGGATSPKKLARTIGVHLDTVYASIKRLSPLVEHTYGDVQLASKYIAQEVTGYIDSVKESINKGLEGALDALFRAETHGKREDPWTRWLDQYGGNVRRVEGADPDRLEVGFTPSTLDEAKRLLRSGAQRWAEVTGEPLRRFGFEFAPVVKLVDGTRYAPERFADALGKPG